jgi:hypothetical protein
MVRKRFCSNTFVLCHKKEEKEWKKSTKCATITENREEVFSLSLSLSLCVFGSRNPKENLTADVS